MGLVIFLILSIYLSFKIILNHQRETYLIKIAQKIANIGNRRF
ncbi:hypothetical protein CWATWH0005_2806 [Crocosphaera watsonii WH 0005]|uniref:Uncharacterized protein n=1 Tax=Crocosphaera watsonii WH 0005 TaxID=423472 RepID=T2IZX8_CROWT|nr:hypothetical protein CWATWH0005_2806 [Crocosphaera watsonii WH 0005]